MWPMKASSENLIPFLGSHFRGLWKANIKSGKYHLRKTVGNLLFTHDELSVLLSQVELRSNRFQLRLQASI